MRHNLVPFTQTERDQLLVLSLNRPARNIHGDLGPRCPTCSGLGHYLGLIDGAIVRSTSRCKCEGGGIDFARLERASHEAMWARIHEIERQMALPETPHFKIPKILNSRQYWMECIAWATADGTAIASSTTETILFPNVTIPANYMQDGRCLRLYANGKYSTLGSGTVSHVYQVRWGGVAGTVICKTGTVTLLISMTNALFEIEVELQTRSNGATGTIMGNGKAVAFGGTAPTIGSATGAPAVSPLTNGGQTVPAAATCDLTADTALSITLTHGANNASNTATGLQYSIESKN